MRVFNRKLLNTLWADLGSRSTVPEIKIQQGWTAEKPPFEYENERRNFTEEAIAYLYQNGIADWAAGQEYVAGALCKSSGVIYKALVNTTGDTPASSPAKWVKAFEDYQDFAGQLADLQEYVDNQDYALSATITANKTASDNADAALQDNIDAVVADVADVRADLTTEVNDRLLMGTNLATEISTQVQQLKVAMFESIFPVGSFYIGDSEVNPNVRWESFIGYMTTWVRVENRFLFGAADVLTPLFSDGDIAGATFGSDKVTLSVDNLPPHAHGQRADSDGGSDQPQVTNAAGSVDGLRGQTDPATTGKTQVMTAQTGGGVPVDIMPPLRVTRMWRRTA